MVTSQLRFRQYRTESAIARMHARKCVFNVWFNNLSIWTWRVAASKGNQMHIWFSPNHGFHFKVITQRIVILSPRNHPKTTKWMCDLVSSTPFGSVFDADKTGNKTCWFLSMKPFLMWTFQFMLYISLLIVCPFVKGYYF